MTVHKVSKIFLNSVPLHSVDMTRFNFSYISRKTRMPFNFNITATPAFSIHITTFRMYINKITFLKHYFTLVKLMKITRVNILI